MLLAAATSSQLLNLPVLQLPCPVRCTCCEGPTGPTSGIRRYSTSKTTPMASFSACSSCNIATARSERHDKSAAAARSLPGSRSKAVDGGWGGGGNSCREPLSPVWRLNSHGREVKRTDPRTDTHGHHLTVTVHVATHIEAVFTF